MAKKKRRMSKKTRAYRTIQNILQVIFILLIVFILFFGITHTFTHKKEYRRKGLLAYNNKDYVSALEYFDKALACNQWFSDEINVDIMLYQADCYMKLDDFLSANSIYLNLAKNYKHSNYFDNDSINFMIDLTIALDQYKSGDFTTPLVTLKKAVDKEMYEMSLYVATCYEAQENYDYMKQYYDIYNTHFGMDSYLYYKYASYYLYIDDVHTALSYVEKGLTSDYVYQQQLAYTQILCYEQLQDYQKAYDLTASYVASYPDDEAGASMYAFLDTRIHPNENIINDKFGLNKDENEIYEPESLD